MYAEPVKPLAIVLPLVGTVIAAMVPLVRYAWMQRDERTALEIMADVHRAQHVVRSASGGFATDVASLTTPCDGQGAVLAPEVLERLGRAAYTLRLRAAAGARMVGRDCLGRELADDYYLAVAPVSPGALARQAFSSRSDGRIYFFVDGVPPREADIDRGLPTPLEARDSFRIP
jgi:hypothetical protein